MSKYFPFLEDMHDLTYLSIRYYLSERFRLRFEDAGIEEMTEEEATTEPLDADAKAILESSGAIPLQTTSDVATETTTGQVRTLDGAVAGDEFEQDSVNYQILLGKIDTLLDRLKLDA